MKGMNFIIVLAKGDKPIETINSWVPDDNDFRTASMMAAAALFSHEGIDNVTCYRKFDDKTVSEDNFFYAEKG